MPDQIQQMPAKLAGLWSSLAPTALEYGAKLLGALVILVVGWFVAKIAAAIVVAALKRTHLDNKLAGWISGAGSESRLPTEQWIGKGVFYLIMLFVLMAFFDALSLKVVTEPLNGLLSQLFEFAPRLLAAGGLVLAAWIIATVLRKLVTRVLSATDLDKRLGLATDDTEAEPALAGTLGEVVYWLVFLLFLPAILGALQLAGLLSPVQSMLDKGLGFLPNIVAAAVILIVGWFVARIIQRVVSGLLAAVGADALSERVGLSSALGNLKLSALAGHVVYALVLLPVLIASLNALALDAVTRPASNMLNAILGALPGIFTAIVILAIAYFVGKLVSELVANLLSGIGFNGIAAKLGIGSTEAMTRQPSELAGSVLLVAVMLFAAIEAAGLLGFEMLSALLAEFTAFGARVLFGLVIFAIGMYLARIVVAAVNASGTTNASFLASVARVAILALTGAMALEHMGIANEIINLAFGLLLGAIAVAAALAFGLGAREVAGQQVQKWVGSASAKK